MRSSICKIPDVKKVNISIWTLGLLITAYEFSLTLCWGRIDHPPHPSSLTVLFSGKLQQKDPLVNPLDFLMHITSVLKLEFIFFYLAAHQKGLYRLLRILEHSTRSSMTSTCPAENPFNYALHILSLPSQVILLLSSYYTCISNYYCFPL